MDLRGKLRKAAGLFVELPPEEETPREAPATHSAAEADIDRRLAAMSQTMQTIGDAPPSPTGTVKSVEQIVREAEGPNLDAIHVSATVPPPAPAPDGTTDFSAVYEQASLPAAPFTAEQMLEMLASLPPELPLQTKRQTVKVTLGAMGKAIGATPESIVADASRKLAALAACAENVSKQTADFVAAAEFEIKALQEQIEEKRRGIEASKEVEARTMQSCNQESDRLDDVLEFFSLDIAPSKYAASGDAQQPPPLPPDRSQT